MTLRIGGSWQLMLADLSLILFATAALAADGAPQETVPLPAQGAGTAILHSSGDLARWLDQQARDPRQRLTIAVRHAPSGRAAALSRAERLARQAEARGLAVRLVVEPGEEPGVLVTLTFDKRIGSLP